MSETCEHVSCSALFLFILEMRICEYLVFLLQFVSLQCQIVGLSTKIHVLSEALELGINNRCRCFFIQQELQSQMVEDKRMDFHYLFLTKQSKTKQNDNSKKKPKKKGLCATI